MELSRCSRSTLIVHLIYLLFLSGLPPDAAQLLTALADGATLKVHRTLDGSKIHKLHLLHGNAVTVSSVVVRTLEKRGWVRSNMKFPAATYLLTEKGWQVLGRALHGPDDNGSL